MAKERKKAELREDTTIEMDMTPMIDIVFQMVMFFIIITDFTQQDIAVLELPWSTVGQTDEGDNPERQIINITAPRPSQAEIAAEPTKWNPKRVAETDQLLLNGKSVTPSQIRKFLAASCGPAYKPDIKTAKNPDGKGPTVSRVPMLIRCDGAQAFDYVKLVLQICAQPDVAIYKIEIATAEKAGEN